MVADLRAILKHLPGFYWDRRPRGPTGSSTPQPRFVSLRVVAYPEPEALPAVMKLVESDENCTVKRNVSAVLGGLADRGTVWTHFHQHLFTGTPCERLAAMSALAHCPECDEQVASSLVQILTDPSSSLELKEGAAGAFVTTADATLTLEGSTGNENRGEALLVADVS